MRNIPKRIIDKNSKEMIRVYQKAYVEIYNILYSTLDYKENPNFSQLSMYSALKQIEDILYKLGVDVQTLVTTHIQDCVERGYLDSVIGYLSAENLTGVALATAILEFPFSALANDVAEQFAKDTFKDLLQANNNTAYSIQQLMREVFSKHMAAQALLDKSYHSAASEILKDLTGTALKKKIENGVISIVDKAGRRWKLETYVDMVVKTKYQQARVEGMREFAKETGRMDLARIPTNGAKDHCRIFEGLVISLTGATNGYQTYDDLQATNLIFHPRCRHTPMPIKSLDHLHDEEKEFHEMLNNEMVDYLKNINQ